MNIIFSVLKDRYFLAANVVIVVLEAVTVICAFANYGHAGPSGFGWICFVLNLPGIAVAARIVDQPESVQSFAILVFVIQICILSFIAFLVRYRIISKRQIHKKERDN